MTDTPSPNRPRLSRKQFARLTLGGLCSLAAARGSNAWGSATAAPKAGTENRLWFNQPAEKWTDALPIGSGRLGAMVFGGTSDERIQFNEDTLWQGTPHNYVRAGAKEHLGEIRALLTNNQPDEAAKIVRAAFLSDPIRQKPYQPFGDLRLHFPGHETVSEYRRELDLENAIARVTYRVGGIRYRREVFASYPDRVIVVRLTADRPAGLTCTLKMDSPHGGTQTKTVAPDVLAMTGQVEDGGLRFESRVRVLVNGGTTHLSPEGESLVEKADTVTLLLCAATSFRNFQAIDGDPGAVCAQDMNRLTKRSYGTLLSTHQKDHQRLFGRVRLDLGRTDRAELPTDQRITRVKTDGLDSDPALAALHFQYGRYLMIASSRPGTQPANLQGIWNDSLDPPWESKWTTNINVQMNYWPVEVAHLSECHSPLFDLIDDLVISGKRTAQEQYGCRGWVLHHNTDIWRGTAPINNIDGVWPTGGAWLCWHLWEHYLFTGDRDFLARRAYPAMKEAALFFMDYLVKDDKTGWLVTSPSYSPEQGTLTRGPAMDSQLVRSLMDTTLEAARLLKKDTGEDRAFVQELAAIRLRVAPDQIGKHGHLQEWLEDIDVPNNNHRHMSPLWAMYPGADITPAQPQLWEAAKVLLKWRGDGSTGWSFAWRIPLQARIGDGENAYRQLAGLLQKRTLPNLLDLCGPFQIDGNFGAPAGIAEMLLQSHECEPAPSSTRVLRLLPALPAAWPDGSVKGLCARGGFELDLTWKAHKLSEVILRSKLGNPCRLRCGNETVSLETRPGKSYRFDGSLLNSGTRQNLSSV